MNKLTIYEIIEHCKRKTTRYEQINGIKELENSDISNNFIKEYWEHRQVTEYLEELQQYRSIGKVEECQEARERQIAKKPKLCMNEVSGMFVDYVDGHGEYKHQMNNWWRCPCCNGIVGERVNVHGRIHNQRKKNYCEKCGQFINWNDIT